MESRILLKPVLGRGRENCLNISLILMNRLNLTESAVFLYCRFSLFLGDPFSRLFIIHVCPHNLLLLLALRFICVWSCTSFVIYT